MKHFYLILTLASLVGASVPVSAQISIDEVNAERRNVTFRDRLKSTSVDADYFSLARYKAERAAIRKERNYLEFSGGIQVHSRRTTTRGSRSRAVTTPLP